MRPSVALIYVAIAVIAISTGGHALPLTALPLELAALFGAIFSLRWPPIRRYRAARAQDVPAPVGTE
jgi:hypothetical protein